MSARSPRRPTSIMAQPVLVGAVTTLIVVVAVFLSYNANDGLPFVPVQQVNVQLPNGGNLLPGNEVREGGERIGVVSAMRAVPLPGGKTGAEATLKIDKDAAPIPADTRIAIRPRSVLGLKYVEVVRGGSRRTLPEGATLPVSRAHIPVELDQLYDIFDEPTREASRENLRGWGGALSQRGASINRALEEAPPFLRDLEPVMRTLADPDTELDRFFGELGDAARAVAPVADRYAHSFEAGADTFEAWSRHPRELQQTIERSAPTMAAGVRSFRVQRPFLTEFARFSRGLENASAQLPRTLPRIQPALEAGIPQLERSPAMNERLEDVLRKARALFETPGTGIALRGLGETVDILNPTLRFVGPYVTVCNYFNYAWTHAGEHLTEPDPTGFAQRTLLNQAPRTRNPTDPSLGSIGARTPSNGEEVVSGAKMYLHSNAYSAAINRDGTADCESGQRGYLERVNTYGPKDQRIVVDPHTPGSQGPTFSGRARVLPGQTFTRAPEYGPRLPKELDR